MYLSYCQYQCMFYCRGATFFSKSVASSHLFIKNYVSMYQNWMCVCYTRVRNTNWQSFYFTKNDLSNFGQFLHFLDSIPIENHSLRRNPVVFRLLWSLLMFFRFRTDITAHKRCSESLLPCSSYQVLHNVHGYFELLLIEKVFLKLDKDGNF